MGSYCLMGTMFLFGMMKSFWKWIVVMIAQVTPPDGKKTETK